MRHLLLWFWSILVMPMFAAGSVVVEAGGGDVSADNGSGDVGSGAEDTSGADDGAGTEGESTSDADVLGSEFEREIDENADTGVRKPTAEELALQEFKGPVEQRLKGLLKRAPELNEAFKRDPKLRDELAAVMRRETAFRDVFPTVAEARQMREKFPNGLQDVAVLEQDLAEMEQVDKLWYGTDQDGNYSGHPQLLENFYKDDPKAAVAMFRNLPKQWARLDPESWNEAGRGIVGATVRARGWENFVSNLIGSAKNGGDAKRLAASLEELLGDIKGFTAGKARPSEEEERIASERKQLDRERSQDSQKQAARFNESFQSASRGLSRQIVGNHPALKRLEKVSSISPEKRAAIQGKVWQRMQEYLKKSPSFMRQLRSAYDAHNLEECSKVQRAAWSNPHLLNRMVRSVMNEEVPQMISQNREQTGRRTGAPVRKVPAKTGEQRTTPKGPRKENGVWLKADGTRFSSAEILAGKHLQS